MRLFAETRARLPVSFGWDVRPGHFGSSASQVGVSAIAWLVLLPLVLACKPASPPAPNQSLANVPPVGPAAGDESVATDPQEPTIQVHPGEDLQAALDRAADAGIRSVIVHAGTYRPPEPRQALIWFNRKHHGLQVRAEGEVVLTAANEAIANRRAASFPAVVNHVVYFGDGVGPETKLMGFKITGANNYVTTKLGPPIEPSSDLERLKKTTFFYTDGGGIKIFGRSYPTLENLEIYDNYASPCGAGISIEHRGFNDQAVVMRNCVLRNNRVPLTGAALDLLDHEYGSAAIVENCLFVENLSNCSMDERSLRLGTWKAKEGHGAVTVFAFSKAQFNRCTFVGNRNGVDDQSDTSTYANSIFWHNTAPGGWPGAPRYETDIHNGGGVSNCYVGGGEHDRAGKLDPKVNVLDAPDPEFDARFNPRNQLYDDEQIGYRDGRERPSQSSESPSAAVGLHGEAAPEVPIELAIRGRDFNWYVEYAGPEGQFGTGKNVTSRRNLIVPADTEVRLRIDSDDYLYTLSLPSQAVKEIAVPGLTHHSRFKVERAGVYPLIGDQFCGYTHPNLIGKLIVQSPNAFSDWYRQQSPAFKAAR